MGVRKIDILKDDGEVALRGTTDADYINTYKYSGNSLSYGEADPQGTYWGYRGYHAYGYEGDDNLSASFVGSRATYRHDALFGGDGDDAMSVSTYDATHSYLTANGGMGRDRLYIMGLAYNSLPESSFTAKDTHVYLRLRSSDGSTFDALPTYETEYIELESGLYYLTEDLSKGVFRDASWDEVFYRTAFGNSDWYVKQRQTIDYYYIGTAGSDSLIGNKGAHGDAWASDVIEGGQGNDFIGGGGGKDFLYGGEGNDEIRAGYGHDILTGESGADVLYGGGGANEFQSEQDGYEDNLFIMSDFRGHGHEWGRNHGGSNADSIIELDSFDRITILGTSTENLSIRNVSAGDFYQVTNGIGIFDGDSLEAFYEGTSLTAWDIAAMTTGDPTRFW